jgi:lipopolysaccharide export system permease protein
MCADNELVIMRTSGMSFRQISMPVISFGIACFVFAMAASFYAAPAGVTRLRETVSRTIAKRAPLAIEEGIFNTSFKGVVLYVNERTPEGDLKNIFIYDERRKGEPAVLLAREGRIETPGDMSITFNLRDGRIHMARDNSATVLSFGRYVLSFPFTIGDKPLRSFQELTPLKLWRAASGTRGEEEKTRILLELHRRLTLPALCLILMVLGPPLSLMAGRSGKMGGLALGILVFALYYAGVVYTEGQAIAGKIPLWLGAWGPAIVLGVVSALLFRRASSR